MPTPRRNKNDHLLYADVVDSKQKAGVWMGERDAFQAKQTEILEAVKDQANWVPVKDAIMVVSTEPAGITIIAPNPTLPGVIVLADGGSPEASAQLQAAGEELVRKVMAERGIVEEEAA
ncbi:hypothetical protein [Streptomyces diastatochromogenes]|uniref:Uncharacterized protein n=1 Tax=Streptomyces diastatochromogenes TaxID=42236 RepID=A0A233S8G6_STRDA|nr:hypothetical protein [Streptomyces diastatochromogenes]MCZ0990401.1 hypothetical protein [Streptomyces diastatochromogenes]OXY91892.1 hypothetical protein BEK98_27730 [Streptomyces diastatochromogenes]